MYSLQGFFNFAPFVDNTRDQVALFGELSDDGHTYAKDKAYLHNNQDPQTTLVVFLTQQDGTYRAVPSGLGDRIITVGQWLFNRALDGLIPSSPNDLRAQLQTEFDGLIGDVSVGAIKSNGDTQLTEWVSFTDLTLEDDNQITVWLSDESFRLQYTEYELEIIPPFQPLDDFFLDSVQVKQRLNAIDVGQKIEEVQSVRGEYPYTQLLTMRFDYHDPVNANNSTQRTDWYVLVYGQAGNNPDLIKNAIVDFVLENSTHTREEWTAVLPDLFTSTEYVIVPFWHKYSVPQRELQAGMFSPIINPREGQTILRQAVRGNGFSSGWIDLHCEFSQVIYKSLAFGVVGNPQNRDEITSFYGRFSDYIVVTNDSPDFNRMSRRTQEFVVMLSELIKIAETMTPISSVPVGFARLTRDGITYVSRQYEQVLYLVASQESVDQIAESL